MSTYDSLSRLLSANNPESGTTSYAYDPNGNLLQKTSPAPNQTGSATQTIGYCYDALNRVTLKAYSALTCANNVFVKNPPAAYAHDAGPNGIGHLTSWGDQAGSGSYTYDALGRITTEQRTIAAITKSLSYTYNLDGSIATLTYPSGAVVTYTPDSAGRILSAVDEGNSISYVTNATYEADGQITGFVSGGSNGSGGIGNAFTYNTRLQPSSISATSATQTVLSLEYNFHLGAGDNGNVWGIANNRDTTRNQTFSYDALNRLLAAQNAGTDCTQKTVNGGTKYWGNSYGYDPWGNLINKTPTNCSAENLSVTALANNQLSGYGYDAAGNMTHDATTGNTYTFDQENRITGAAGFTYTYDDEGNRVEKSNGSTGTIYWYMTVGIVAESDLTGALKSEYVSFAGERVARRDLPSGAISYYFSDHLKTASVITDSSGNITEESDYYPWGGELQFANSDSNHYKFTGKERDGETGLDYFGARYYGNWLGRFLTPDWAAKPATVPYAELADPQSLNLYSYVRNRPTVLDDPDGHLLNGLEGSMNMSDRGDGFSLFTTSGMEASALGALSGPAPGPTELTLQQVVKLVQQAQQSGADPVTTAIQIFNSLGSNVSVSGDVLRQAIKQTNLQLDDFTKTLLSNATSLGKSGDSVTIVNKQETKGTVQGTDVKVSETVSFHVDAANTKIDNIKGIQGKVAKIWVNMDSVHARKENDHTVLDIRGSLGFIHKTVTVPLD